MVGRAEGKADVAEHGADVMAAPTPNTGKAEAGSPRSRTEYKREKDVPVVVKDQRRWGQPREAEAVPDLLASREGHRGRWWQCGLWERESPS